MRAIISYDDTLNDHDALGLGRLLARAGAELTLAYVRHTRQLDPSREQLADDEARSLLDRGARWLDQPEVERRVVMSASTGEGLRWLAEHEDADIVVFGSDYRTPIGHVAPQASTERLLDGGAAAVAIAPASYRSRRDPRVRTIGVLAGEGDMAPLSTAHELADVLHAELTSAETGVDLLVVGSRREAPEGRVMLASRLRAAVEQATSPVLVLPRGVPLHFRAPVSLH